MKKIFFILTILLTGYTYSQVQLDYTGSQLDTAIMVQRSKIYVQTKHGFQKPYSTIQSAITGSDSGDVVNIRAGYYNLGTDSLKLKNGVDINSEPNVTITSTNANKTISDGNVACVMRLKGFPIINNSNGSNKKIVLSNASSKIKDFYWIYSSRRNDVGDWVATYDSTIAIDSISVVSFAAYGLTEIYSTMFTMNKSIGIMQPTVQLSSPAVSSWSVQYENNKVVLETYDPVGESAINIGIFFEIKVFP